MTTKQMKQCAMAQAVARANSDGETMYIYARLKDDTEPDDGYTYVWYVRNEAEGHPQGAHLVDTVEPDIN